jgi:hypothetical protein
MFRGSGLGFEARRADRQTSAQPGRAGASIPQHCPSAVGAARFHLNRHPYSVAKHFQDEPAELQILIRLRSGQTLHFAPADFPWNLVASGNLMRLSLRKGAHAALSSAVWQEIRVRFGPTARRDRRDDSSCFGRAWAPKKNWHPEKSYKLSTSGTAQAARY